MSLPIQVEDINEVAEPFREFYIQEAGDDGGEVFKLNTDGVAKKLANSTKILHEKKKLGDRLSQFEKAMAGKDPAEVLQKLEEFEAAEAKKQETTAATKADFDKLKKKLEDEFAAKEVKYQEEIQERDTTITRKMVDTEATMAIVALGSKHAKTILPHVRDAVEVVRLENGDRVVRVKENGKAGDYRTSLKTGDFMTMQELIEEMAEDPDFEPLFDAELRGGSGAPPKAASGGAVRKAGNVIFLTREQAKDPKVYRKAREDAKKTGAEIRYSD